MCISIKILVPKVNMIQIYWNAKIQIEIKLFQKISGQFYKEQNPHPGDLFTLDLQTNIQLFDLLHVKFKIQMIDKYYNGSI